MVREVTALSVCLLSLGLAAFGVDRKEAGADRISECRVEKHWSEHHRGDHDWWNRGWDDRDKRKCEKEDKHMTQVPEPESLLIFGTTALAGVGVIRRKLIG